MDRKVFSQRFNSELAVLGFPEHISDKAKAVSKVFEVSTHLATAMIYGQILPSTTQIAKIADILEVCPQWLSGVTEKKKVSSKREVVDSE
jgi:hypothetical protein